MAGSFEAARLAYEQDLRQALTISSATAPRIDDSVLPVDENAEDEEEKCNLCFNNINLASEKLFLTCGHVFRRTCLRKWVSNYTKCPVCDVEIASQILTAIAPSAPSSSRYPSRRSYRRRNNTIPSGPSRNNRSPVRQQPAGNDVFAEQLQIDELVRARYPHHENNNNNRHNAIDAARLSYRRRLEGFHPRNERTGRDATAPDESSVRQSNTVQGDETLDEDDIAAIRRIHDEDELIFSDDQNYDDRIIISDSVPLPSAPSLDELDGDDDQAQCPICLDELRNDRNKIALPCAHLFHLPCIRQWLRQTPTCPVCKRQVDHDFLAGILASSENEDENVQTSENMEAVNESDLRRRNTHTNSRSIGSIPDFENNWDELQTILPQADGNENRQRDQQGEGIQQLRSRARIPNLIRREGLSEPRPEELNEHIIHGRLNREHAREQYESARRHRRNAQRLLNEDPSRQDDARRWRENAARQEEEAIQYLSRSMRYYNMARRQQDSGLLNPNDELGQHSQQHQTEEEDEECFMCETKYSDGESIRLECLHKFHEPCITRWLAVSPTCPVCRHRQSDGFLERLGIGSDASGSSDIGDGGEEINDNPVFELAQNSNNRPDNSPIGIERPRQNRVRPRRRGLAFLNVFFGR